MMMYYEVVVAYQHVSTLPVVGHILEPTPPGTTNESLTPTYKGWNFNSGNYLFTTDTK